MKSYLFIIIVFFEEVFFKVSSSFRDIVKYEWMRWLVAWDFCRFLGIFYRHSCELQLKVTSPHCNQFCYFLHKSQLIVRFYLFYNYLFDWLIWFQDLCLCSWAYFGMRVMWSHKVSWEVSQFKFHRIDNIFTLRNWSISSKFLNLWTELLIVFNHCIFKNVYRSVVLLPTF